MRVFGALLVVSCISFSAPAAPAEPPRPTATSDPSAPHLPPSRWELKKDAPPAVALVLERMKRQRQREFDAQVKAVEHAEKDLGARKSGRVVKQLKTPEGWRAVPSRAGAGVEYAFRTPQIKGQEVVKAERTLEYQKRRLAEISHPDYQPKPVLPIAELREGAAGTVSFKIINQVSGKEAVVRVVDESAAPAAHAANASAAGKELYLSDFPAGEYLPGMILRDWSIEVVGTRNFQGDNGRIRSALHAKPLDWRKWVELVRRPEQP